MRLLVTVFLTYVISWVFAALIHVVDADVGHIGGLWEASVLLSVSVVALLFNLPAWLAYAAYRRGGWKYFVGAVCVMALGSGFLVAGLGSGTSGVGFGALGLAGLFAFATVITASAPIMAGRKTRIEPG